MLDESHPGLPEAVLPGTENHGAPATRPDIGNGGGRQGVPAVAQSSTGRRSRYVTVAAVVGAILMAAGAGVARVDK